MTWWRLTGRAGSQCPALPAMAITQIHTHRRIVARRRGRRARRPAPSRIFQRAVPPKRWVQQRAADATLRLPGRNSVAVRRNAAPEANSNANANARTRTQRLLSRLACGLLVADASRTRIHARKPHCPLAPSHPFKRLKTSDAAKSDQPTRSGLQERDETWWPRRL